MIPKPGEKYHRLTVERLGASTGQGRYFWCVCECGNKTIVKGTLLTCGHTKSCGCLKIETASINFEKLKLREACHREFASGRESKRANKRD